jgi:hypothetical protein
MLDLLTGIGLLIADIVSEDNGRITITCHPPLGFESMVTDLCEVTLSKHSGFAIAM